ncbi:DUF302 domain-containing protein [Pseudahrensia aquimaris]|uniref:DUF302 domain-containing protein n=1 Tax=Pseudahrensia aquimaris TaxID=744461 RepID=A0ABW3FIF4_9HYPH
MPRSLTNSAAALAFATSTLVLSAPASAMDGWIEKASPHSVEKTVMQLTAAIEKAGAKVFAVIDHQAGAKSVGLDMPATTLVLFGNPKIGTPIMQANPMAAHDLPIRVLVWSKDGQTQMAALAPETFKTRYGVDPAMKPLQMMQGAVGKFMDAAAQ